MFTIQCTTCGAKLVVKSDELIGQILACPKCESMVLVEQPRETSPEPPHEPGPVGSISLPPQESGPPIPARETPLPPPLPETGPSDAELRLRKILFGVFALLLLFLIVGFGLLIGRDHRPEMPLLPDEHVVPEEPKVDPAPDPFVPRPIPVEPIQPADEPMMEPPHEPEPVAPAVPQPTPQEPGPQVPAREAPGREEKTEPPPEVRSTTDLLSAMEKKLPGLLKPTPALAIDVPTKLRLPLLEFKVEKTPLIDIIRTLSRLTEVPMTLEIDEFRCRGILIDAPVSGIFGTKTVGETMMELLKPLDLEPVVEDRQVLIAVPKEEKEKLLELSLDIADLLQAGFTADDVAKIVRRLVDPAGFGNDEPNENQPALKVVGKSLLVKHRRRMLDETGRILEQLRVLRGLPQKTEHVGEDLVPEVFGWDAVSVPLTLNYYEPVLLAEVFAQLESVAKIRILIDHRSLNRALSPFATMKGTVQSGQGTVDIALEKLLASVDTAALAYRIVGANILEITTREVSRQPDKMRVYVHVYKKRDPPNPNAEPPDEIVKTIRASLEPASWFLPTDPETLGLGDIVIDQPSGCLIVRQSQPVQRLLRRWFAQQQ